MANASPSLLLPPSKHDNNIHNTLEAAEEHEQAPTPASSMQPQQPTEPYLFEHGLPTDLEGMKKVDQQPDISSQTMAQLSQRAQVKTPEPGRSNETKTNELKDDSENSPSTPGHLAFFDWDDFESRYEQALEACNDHEGQLLDEFKQLVEYFNVWASVSAAHDHARAVKRFKTRERKVKISEQSLQQKKLHLQEVVRAFQGALALLSQT